MKPSCCKEFDWEIRDLTKNDEGHLEKDDEGRWNVLGCCGTCYVLQKLKFCPFCGKELK